MDTALAFVLVLLLLLMPELNASKIWTPAHDQAVHNRQTKTRDLRNITSSNSTAVDCAKYKLTAAAGDVPTPRVIDCFLMNTEIDMAEIRLRELEHVVDVFVILESRMTFRGSHRSLHYPRLINRLPARVIAKVKYVVLDMLEGTDAWAKEKCQRDALFNVGLKEARPEPGDIITVADCDEIPKPMFLLALKHCMGMQYPLSMQATLRYYAYDTVATKNEQYWHQPKAIAYTKPFNTSAQDLRSGATTALFPDTSWHCSWCFSSIQAVQNKLSSFSHAELDTPTNNDPQAIVAKVRAGKDLFSRNGQDFARVKDADMPEFIKAHPSRFGYLITRDSTDAGFRDVDQLE